MVSGIVTETDLCQYFSLDSSGKFKVGDFMTTDFFFAKSNYSVIHVAHALVFKQPAVPVMDEELVGILTLTDGLNESERTGLLRPKSSITYDDKRLDDPKPHHNI